MAKLNEGWDVLNLYDIVRISEKASSTKTGTDSEAQLIGRGARYYPFIYQDKKSYKHRFDQYSNELAILEQLHYHSMNESAYIEKLHTSLNAANVIVYRDGTGSVEHAKLKEDFKKSRIYREGKLYFNEVEEIKEKDRRWQTYSLNKNFEVKYKVANEKSLESLSEKDVLDNSQQQNKKETLKVDQRFYYKALQQISFYQFNNLKIYFPQLTSIKEFIESHDYLGQLTIDIEIPETIHLKNISVKEKLGFVKEVLEKIANNIKRDYIKFKGTYRFIGKPIKDMVKDYDLYIEVETNYASNQKITAENTIGKKWFVYDKAILNQLEHRFVGIISRFMGKLENKYNNIYFIRNDERSTRFKLTEFEGVRGFMPDFLMLLTDSSENVYYQVLLEVKGDDRLLEDAWKEKMLKKINDTDSIIIDEDENIRLVGIRFFADSKRNEFIADFESKLYDGQKLEEQTLLSVN